MAIIYMAAADWQQQLLTTEAQRHGEKTKENHIREHGDGGGHGEFTRICGIYTVRSTSQYRAATSSTPQHARMWDAARSPMEVATSGIPATSSM